MTALQIAKICHEANAAYCREIGDHTQKPWEEAELWQREASLQSVEFLLNKPESRDAVLHNKWLDDKTSTGWIWGEVKDSAAKTHPCLVGFEALPKEQQLKDKLFIAIVRSLS